MEGWKQKLDAAMESAKKQTEVKHDEPTIYDLYRTGKQRSNHSLPSFHVRSNRGSGRKGEVKL